MSLRIKENLSSLIAANNKPIFVQPSKPEVGKVYGVITTENTPTKKQFEKFGGFDGIGTVLYKLYEDSINLKIDNSDPDRFFDECLSAKPLDPNFSFPLNEEIILIQSLPSSNSQGDPAKYYISIINIWNNVQHNAQPAGNEYNFKTFVTSDNTKPLLQFEGDKVIQGRKGNSIRLGSTVKPKSNLNEWSLGPGNDGNPIMILSGGKELLNSDSYHIEEINKEYSSIYLTSTQNIPLITDKSDILNPLTNPTNVSDYYKSQVLLNADRVVINSKTDDILLFATTNIELNTKNIINLNTNNRVHLNSPRVYLGTNTDGTLPTEPLVLGSELRIFLSNLFLDISSFLSDLSSAKSMAEGADLIQIQVAAKTLNDKIINQYMNPDNTSKLVSKQNYTI